MDNVHTACEVALSASCAGNAIRVNMAHANKHVPTLINGNGKPPNCGKKKFSEFFEKEGKFRIKFQLYLV